MRRVTLAGLFGPMLMARRTSGQEDFEMLTRIKIAVATAALALGSAPAALAADHEDQSSGFRELGSGATITEGINPVDHRSLQKALMDARMGYVKAGLQLTADQARYWPAVEDAMRARAQTEDTQMIALTDQLARQVDPITLVRTRANLMAQQATDMKKLVDAWEPLSRSLAPEQKERMRLLAEAGVAPMLCPLLEGYPDCR